jgi:hypothetical protein
MLNVTYHMLCLVSDSDGCIGDESYPRCRRCQKIGRECIRGWNVKFVHGVRTYREAVDDDWDGSADYRFDVDQEWTPIKHLNSKHLSYLLEVVR